ncbi:hypothetical protein GSI_07390 [Ganoderma sinense ZZ0214-1]|uniref:Uncharacterized protein n=1 Tax=Ganoderma sinense ZZ0214-1 TaxID=1077348 RepID=A0A2G8SA96_9APHY|nr:hypothetical protein GSI_07390 [Ganoderma sinense ZZ0214-1]
MSESKEARDTRGFIDGIASQLIVGPEIDEGCGASDSVLGGVADSITGERTIDAVRERVKARDGGSSHRNGGKKGSKASNAVRHPDRQEAEEKVKNPHREVTDPLILTENVTAKEKRRETRTSEY